MPSALHPQAKFDPIPPNLDLHDLVDKTPNFSWVTRLSTERIRNLTPAEFERIILRHVVEGGRPLVIEGWSKALPRSLFSADWLRNTYNKKQENVRDITGQSDIPMTMGHYLRSMPQLTNQWTPTNFRDERRQRLYLKDIDCPPEWHDHLRKVIPACLFYMNGNVEEKANAVTSRQHGDNGFDIFDENMAKTPAIAGDLMSSLPPHMRAENLMCYIGHEGTYTPAHKEMCASLGQNIMVEASGSENGEKPGSSIWFMTESKDRKVIREYFLSMLGHDIEIEKHFAQINAWKKANFPVYIVEQKPGDFILIPPLAPHQVWNRGTRTMKVAWNRTTAQTLKLALQEALPKSRLVCRDEQYKNKAIIYFTLKKYYQELSSMDEAADNSWLDLGQDLVRNSPRLKEMGRDFEALFGLYTQILIDEIFAHKEKDVEYVEFDSNITCSYCRSNIFNRFLTCKHCVRLLINGDEDTYDVCMECYAMGRSCVCTSGLRWCEQFPWEQLVEEHEQWRSLVIRNHGFIDLDNSPQPLELARRLAGKKSVAAICQEQLRRRPFKDITKMEHETNNGEAESPEPEVDEDDRPKKRRKSRKLKEGDTGRCHVCCHREHTYKLQYCATPGCFEAYCYGVLYRAFDMMPQTVMEDENWTCPKCRKICNCGSCRKAGTTIPYQPKNTLLGHDTRPIADDRSIEALVDFRVHNLSWLKVVGEESRNKNSKRMQRLQEEAQADKAKDNNGLEDTLADEEGMTAEQLVALQQSIAIDTVDPALTNGHEQGDVDAPHDEVESAYPDPTGLAGRERMLGLGYYQQDDSPDKILFDPYQMPTAESLEEPQVSEYIKKTLRAAKRKARQETDNDPDFRGPRLVKKPRRSDNPPDLPQNVDPNLFNTTDAPPATATSAENGQAMSPNKPNLRNAQPIASYTEAEEPPIEEFEETVTVDPLVLLARLDARPEQPANEPVIDNRDPLDVASEAIKAITGTGQGTSPGQKRKRGRPRMKPGGTWRTQHRDWVPAVPVEESKPKARMTRASLIAEGFTEEEVEEKLRELHPDVDLDASDAEVASDDVDQEDLEAEIQRQLEKENEDSDSPESVVSDDPADKSFYRPYAIRGGPRRGRGRPRRSDLAALRSQPSSANITPMDPGKRRRGRPPKNRYSEGAVQSVSASPTRDEPPKRFMSLAERMALKGKKNFRIGQRRTRQSAPASGFTAVNRDLESKGDAAPAVEDSSLAPVAGKEAMEHVLEPEPEPEPEPELEPTDGSRNQIEPEHVVPASPSEKADSDGDISMKSPSPLPSPPVASDPASPAGHALEQSSDVAQQPAANEEAAELEHRSPSLGVSNDKATSPLQKSKSPTPAAHSEHDSHAASPAYEHSRSPSPEVFQGSTTFPIPSPPLNRTEDHNLNLVGDNPVHPPLSSPKRNGPTIVRLGTESEEEGDDFPYGRPGSASAKPASRRGAALRARPNGPKVVAGPALDELEGSHEGHSYYSGSESQGRDEEEVDGKEDGVDVENGETGSESESSDEVPSAPVEVAPPAVKRRGRPPASASSSAKATPGTSSGTAAKRGRPAARGGRGRPRGRPARRGSARGRGRRS